MADLAHLTVPQLKLELRSRQLSAAGTKPTLLRHACRRCAAVQLARQAVRQLVARWLGDVPIGHGVERWWVIDFGLFGTLSPPFDLTGTCKSSDFFVLFHEILLTKISLIVLQGLHDCYLG